MPQAADIPPPAHPERSHQRGHGDPTPVQGLRSPGRRRGGAENTPKPLTVSSVLIRSPTSEGFGGKEQSPSRCGAAGLRSSSWRGAEAAPSHPPRALLPPTALGCIPHHVPVLPELQFGLIRVSHALDLLIQGSNALRRGRKTIRAVTRGGVPIPPPPDLRAVPPPSPNGAASAPPAPASRWGSGTPSALSQRSSGTG